MKKKSMQDPLKEETSKPLFIVSSIAFVICVAILLFSQQPHSIQQYAQTTVVTPSPIPSPSTALPPFGCVAIGNCGTTGTTSGTIGAFPSGVPAGAQNIGGTALGGTGGIMGMISSFLQGMGLGNLGGLLGLGGGTTGLGNLGGTGTVTNGGTQTNVVNNNVSNTNGTTTVNGTPTNSNNSVIMLNGTIVPAGGANTASPAGGGVTGTGTTGAGGFLAPVMNFFQNL